jgi:selenocysteine lyase/cysteine desulfurase
MTTQKHLFQLDDQVHYLNCAYMSPLLKSVEEAGIEGLQRKRNPFLVKPIHFFETAQSTNQDIAKLINANPNNIAIIPSASYGLANAVANLPTNNGSKAIIVENEFPSGYNEIKLWCTTNNKTLQTIREPTNFESRGANWNKVILNAIDKDTAVVMLSSVHWSDGTKFLLQEIGQKCYANDAVFIVDGTQSVGAAVIDVNLCNIDALIVAAYKWMLGPYSIGFAYYNDRFANGKPIEQSWLNRQHSEDFSKLIPYQENYKDGASRYNVGQYSNFILLPMLQAAVKQLIAWEIKNIETYCETLSKPLFDFLETSNYTVENKEFRSSHLFGIWLPATLDQQTLLQELEANKIFVSVRGKSIRVSIHPFNTSDNIDALLLVLKKFN